MIELSSLRELITEKPIRGWGEDPKKVEAVIKDDPEALAMFREAMSKQGERHDLDNNVIHVDTPQGNSRAYSIDRVKRECDEETVAKVMSGEMSPNAATATSTRAYSKQHKNEHAKTTCENVSGTLWRLIFTLVGFGRLNFQTTTKEPER